MTLGSEVREWGLEIYVIKGIGGEMQTHLVFTICDSHGLELGQAFDNLVTYSSSLVICLAVMIARILHRSDVLYGIETKRADTPRMTPSMYSANTAPTLATGLFNHGRSRRHR